MSDHQGPTVRRRRLGNELREIREERGLTLQKAARLLNRSHSSMSKLETGTRGIRRPALENLLDRYGVLDIDRRQRLFDLAEEARTAGTQGWWQSYDDTLSPETLELIGLESDSILVESLEIISIPGLLQVEEYARALMASGPFAHDPDHLERQVKVRMKRCEVVAGEHAPNLVAIIDEAALRRQVGGPEVMRAQLAFLIQVMDLVNVEVRVLPFAVGANQGMAGAFKILHIGARGDLKVVVVDSLTQIAYREGQREIQTYLEAFERVARLSLSETDSRSFILRLLSET